MADPVNTGFDPEFGGPLAKFRAALDAQGIQTKIISGVRSDEDQRQLVANRDAGRAGRPLPYPARGPVRVAAPVGSSVHEIGLGADVQPVHPADAARMHQLAQQFGLAMPNWGGADPYHIQLGNWQNARASQAPNTPWGTLPNVPSQYASNTSAETPSGGGFRIPGGSAPIAGALAETGPESSNAAGRTADEGPQDPRQIVFNRLISAGLNPQQALGALWSLGGEGGAGLNPRSYNAKDPGGSIGYGQWNRERRTALENLALSQDKTWSDPNVQADHLFNELTNKNYASYQPGVLDALKAAKTPEEAAQVWTGKYERPKVDNSADRIKGGAKVATLGDDGNLVLGSAASLAARPAGVTAGGTRDDFAMPGNDAARNKQAAENQSWFGRFTQGPIDPDTGKPSNPTGKTPMQTVMDSVLNSRENMLKKVEDAGPEKTALSDMPPALARNVSPMGGAQLPNVPMTYGQTLNSFSRPLTYNAAPPQAPQMPAAGFQGSFGPQVPGVSLMSPPALPMGPMGPIRPLTLNDYGYQGAGYAS